MCDNADALALAFDTLENAFDLREGNGRLKNMLDTKEATPPRMMLNVMLAGGAMVAEIQLYLSDIRVLAKSDHNYYKVLRADKLLDLIEPADNQPGDGARGHVFAIKSEDTLRVTERAPANKQCRGSTTVFEPRRVAPGPLKAKANNWQVVPLPTTEIKQEESLRREA